MKDTAVNATGAKVAHNDGRQGDREESEDRDDRAMADMDEPEMADEVTEFLMGHTLSGENSDWGIIHSTQDSAALPVTQPKVIINRLHSRFDLQTCIAASVKRIPELLNKSVPHLQTTGTCYMAISHSIGPCSIVTVLVSMQT